MSTSSNDSIEEPRRAATRAGSEVNILFFFISLSSTSFLPDIKLTLEASSFRFQHLFSSAKHRVRIGRLGKESTKSIWEKMSVCSQDSEDDVMRGSPAPTLRTAAVTVECLFLLSLVFCALRECDVIVENTDIVHPRKLAFPSIAMRERFETNRPEPHFPDQNSRCP